MTPINAQQIEVLRDLAKGTGKDVLSEVIKLFLQSGPERLEQMKQALAQQDAVAFEHACHAMKGSAGTLGASALLEVCDELGVAARNGELPSRLSSLDVVVEEYHSAAAELGEMLSPEHPLRR